MKAKQNLLEGLAYTTAGCATLYMLYEYPLPFVVNVMSIPALGSIPTALLSYTTVFILAGCSVGKGVVTVLSELPDTNQITAIGEHSLEHYE